MRMNGHGSIPEATNFNFLLCLETAVSLKRLLSTRKWEPIHADHAEDGGMAGSEEHYPILLQHTPVLFFPYFYRHHPTDHRLDKTPRSTMTTMDDQHRLHSLLHAFN